MGEKWLWDNWYTEKQGDYLFMLDCTYYNLITIFVQHIAYVFFTVG